MIPVVLLLGWSPEWLFLAALVATVERGLYEYFRISRQAGLEGYPVAGYVTGAALCLAQWVDLRTPGALTLVVLVCSFLATLALALAWTQDLKTFLSAVATTTFGVFYVGFTLSWLIPLRFLEPASGQKLTFLLFLVIWAGDISAFLVGRSVGRRLLFPRVSPRKTVEGALAGFAGSLLVAVLFARLFWQTADVKTVILWGGVVAVAGQIGDLVESALKRGADLKDSAAIFPGHGGLLDRIDSLLFGVPALWVVVSFQNFWPS
jgi:phosphatidate cytidylyltransferase